jgi:uncharacterized protein DUF6328
MYNAPAHPIPLPPEDGNLPRFVPPAGGNDGTMPPIDSDTARPDEDEKARVDRELIELLNELRVALPGVQILFAFLLVIPFNTGFAELSTLERWVYYAAFVSAALAAVLLIAPSSYHRLRFREGDKEQMLFTSNKLVLTGMAFVAVSMTLAVGLISEVVLGMTQALIAGAVVGGWVIWFWYGLPLSRKI